MPRQLMLGFGDEDRPQVISPQIKGSGVEEAAPVVAVAEIAESLRPRVLAYLRKADGQVRIHELRTELGHPTLDTETDPQSNPVNRILKEMRDRGEVVCSEPEWGEPSFSLPATTPSEVEDARIPEPGSWESDVECRFDLNFVQPVMRELQQRPWSTSEAIGNRALGHKRIDNRIRTAADILQKKVKAGAVQIAWDTTGMPHYALVGVPRPGDLASQEQVDAAGGAFPCLQPSSPIESQSSQDAPPLVRPDRQFTFDGAPHYEWPKPEEDRDTITVDRLRDDIDGPSHRFLIRRGDTVEVFFRRDKMEVGEVVGISHANHEVRVRFGDRGAGIWFAVGQIYPTVEASPEQGTTAPLSATVEQASPPPDSPRQLPQALKNLQQGNIAPVDLAQAAIGPASGCPNAVCQGDGNGWFIYDSPSSVGPDKSGIGRSVS